MDNKMEFYWNLIHKLENENSHGFISAFEYLIYELKATQGIIWNIQDKITPVYTTLTNPENKLVKQCLVNEETVYEKNDICIPIIQDQKILYCFQINGVSDIETVQECTKIFSKYIIPENRETKMPRCEKVVISIKDIQKSFGHGDNRVKVLKGISFDIYENEFLVILGASGTGKTTLLNILGGLDFADSGSVMVGDFDLVHANAKQLNKYRRKDVGFVFQFYSLMPNLTAEENLRYISEMVPGKMTAKEALQKVGLENVSNHYPSQLSSGQQQRVAIARALIKSPRIILADEPTGALDLSTSKDVLITMEEITASKQGTIVLITHNPEICKIADRVIVMRQGLVESITTNMQKQSAASLRW